MTVLRGVLPYLVDADGRGDNLLLLDDLLEALAAHGLREDVLLRASEAEKLDKILAQGSDRAGYPGDRRWRHDPSLAHEDVIFATTPQQNREADADAAASSSLKKFSIIEAPLLLVYAAAELEQLRATEFRFRRPAAKLEALRAVLEIRRVQLPAGWFSRDEGHGYRALARAALDDARARGVIVEVGCWLGRSTSYLAGLVRARGSRLVCIDHWSGSSDGYDAAYRQRLAAREIERDFRAHLGALDCAAEILRAPSLEAAASIDDGSVDLVFLDGSHDQAAVAGDIAAWWPKLRPGGLLAGHDFGPSHPGVVAAVESAARARGLQLGRGPGSVWTLSAGASAAR